MVFQVMLIFGIDIMDNDRFEFLIKTVDVYFEEQSDENFEEQTRRVQHFLVQQDLRWYFSSKQGKVQRFYFPVEYADNAYKG